MKRLLIIFSVSVLLFLAGCQQMSMSQDVIVKFRNYQVTTDDIELHSLTKVNKEKAKSRILWYMIYEHAVQHGYSPQDDLNTVVATYIRDHTPNLLLEAELAHREAITDLMDSIYEQYEEELVWNGSYQF